MSRYRRASEVGEFVFCHRAWWLHQVQGLPPQNRAVLESGRVAHDRHGRAVAWAILLRRAAWVLAIAALLLFVFSIWGSG